MWCCVNRTLVEFTTSEGTMFQQSTSCCKCCCHKVCTESFLHNLPTCQVWRSQNTQRPLSILKWKNCFSGSTVGYFPGYTFWVPQLPTPLGFLFHRSILLYFHDSTVVYFPSFLVPQFPHFPSVLVPQLIISLFPWFHHFLLPYFPHSTVIYLPSFIILQLFIVLAGNAGCNINETESEHARFLGFFLS